MLHTYDGIVVGRREIGENSCFIDILTDECGLIEATAHGAKKLNSSLLSSAALFSYSTFCLNSSKGRYTVNSAKPIHSFHTLGRDIERLALASYFAQAVRFCTPSEQRQSSPRGESLVRFMAIALYELGRRDAELVRAAFELRYSCILGFTPDLTACANCGRYEHEQMFFLPDTGEIFCGDCFDREYGGEHELLLPQTLSAMRGIVFSPLEGCFKIKAQGDALKQLSRLAERYFLRRTERSFGALRYYKTLAFPTESDTWGEENEQI